MADFDWKVKSYWNGNGKYQEAGDALRKLIPDSGEVNWSNELEELRQCINAYYDLYNNGGGNRDAAILYFSGIDKSYGKEGGMHSVIDDHGIELLLDGHDWDEVAAALEPEMDHLILMAAADQDIDVTTV